MSVQCPHPKLGYGGRSVGNEVCGAKCAACSGELDTIGFRRVNDLTLRMIHALSQADLQNPAASNFLRQSENLAVQFWAAQTSPAPSNAELNTLATEQTRLLEEARRQGADDTAFVEYLLIGDPTGLFKAFKLEQNVVDVYAREAPKRQQAMQAIASAIGSASVIGLSASSPVSDSTSVAAAPIVDMSAIPLPPDSDDVSNEVPKDVQGLLFYLRREESRCADVLRMTQSRAQAQAKARPQTSAAGTGLLFGQSAVSIGQARDLIKSNLALLGNVSAQNSVCQRCGTLVTKGFAHCNACRQVTPSGATP